MDREIRQQCKGVGDRKRTVQRVRRLADSEGVGELQIGITQERETGAEARLEGGQNSGRIDGNDGDPAVRRLGYPMELDQFPQLVLSLGSPGTPEEGQEGGLPAGPVRDRELLLAVVQQRNRGKFLSDFELQRHLEPEASAPDGGSGGSCPGVERSG